MATGLVPTIIETVEKTMHDLQVDEALSPNDEALAAVRRKVALEIGELISREGRFAFSNDWRTAIPELPPLTQLPH
jgi:hypothetical protein